MSIRQLTEDQIRAIISKTKATPTKSEIVRDLLRNPAPVQSPPTKPKEQPNGIR